MGNFYAEAGKQLFRDLKEVCATGVAPDFSNVGALHYYTLQVRSQMDEIVHANASQRLSYQWGISVLNAP